MFSSSELQENEAKCNTTLPLAVIDICYQHIAITDFKHVTK